LNKLLGLRRMASCAEAAIRPKHDNKTEPSKRDREAMVGKTNERKRIQTVLAVQKRQRLSLQKRKVGVHSEPERYEPGRRK
jgi:hypothetical protein